MTTGQNIFSEQDWFKSCPIGLLELDAQGHICGVNSVLEEITGLSKEYMLKHNKDTPAPCVPSALLGDDNLMHLQGPELNCWLQRTTRELTGTDGKKITLLYFQDVTETHQLRQQNEHLLCEKEELSIIDTLTGLTNRRALTQMLDAQVTRSRRYQNPLSLALTEIVPQNAEPVSDELILSVSNYLRDRLRWADVLGRWDGSRFMLMLPETPEEAARTLVENITFGAADLASVGGKQTPAFQLQFGLVEWSKGLDTKRLTQQVEHALDAATASMAS